MELSYLLIIIVLSAITTPARTQHHRCLEFGTGNCIRCDPDSRLVSGKCKDLIPGCV